MTEQDLQNLETGHSEIGLEHADTLLSMGVLWSFLSKWTKPRSLSGRGVPEAMFMLCGSQHALSGVLAAAQGTPSQIKFSWVL